MLYERKVLNECLFELPTIEGWIAVSKGNKVDQPVRFIKASSGLRSLGDGGAGFYAIGDKTYRVQSHSGKSDKGAHLEYDLDSTAEVDRVPSKHWNTPPVDGTPVNKPNVLDLLEQHIIDTSPSTDGYTVTIRRDGEVYQVTPQGMVHIPQRTPSVA